MGIFQNPSPKRQIPRENFTKKNLHRILNRILTGEIRPSSKFFMRYAANPRVHARAVKSDIKFVVYGWDKSKKKVTTKILGTYTQYESRPDWLRELKDEKSIEELEAEEVNSVLGIDGSNVTAEPEHSGETMEQLFDRYFDSTDFQNKKTHKSLERQIQIHFLTEFGHRPWDSIKPQELSDWHERTAHGQNQWQLAQNKPKQHNGTAATANRNLSAVNGGLSWLIKRHYIAQTFYRPPKMQEDTKQQLPLPPLQLRAYWYAAGQISNRRAGAIIRLLILTGQREDAIAGLRWADLTTDKENQCGWLTVPVERSKGGHVYSIPVAAEVINILSEFGHEPDLLFPTEKGYVQLDGHVKARCEAHMIEYLQKHGKTEEQKQLAAWRPHNVRKNIRNIYAALGVPDRVAELLIGHQLTFESSSEAAYLTRKYYPELLAAMRKATPKILELVEGNLEIALNGELTPEGPPLRENLAYFRELSAA